MRQEFNHQFTNNDCKTYVEHKFTVPAGTQQLDFHLQTYTPLRSEGQEYPNQVNFTLFDPSGTFRGWRYSREGTRFSVGAHSATYGFIAGEIMPGEWTLTINAFRILPPSTLDFSLVLETSTEETLEPLPAYWRPKSSSNGAGWYMGDLHSHTFHSDGGWSVEHINAFYRRIGLDFLHLSDHNTISGNAHHRSLSDENFLCMAGMELTTPWGHAVAVGIEDWVDWGIHNTTGEFREIAKTLKENDIFLTIAHPKNIGEPHCGGCRWIYEDDVADVVSGVEIWNGIWALDESNNEQALELYYSWLNRGLRLTATSGTDIHGFPEIYQKENGETDVRWVKNVTDEHINSLTEGQRLPGVGFNVVWADSFDETSILNGLKAGRSYITDGPKLEMTGSAAENGGSGSFAMLGGTLPVSESARINLHWSNCIPGDTIRLIVNGEVFDTIGAGEHGTKRWMLASGQAQWVTVEVRNQYGHLRAVSNPIYFE
ncbi:MAG: CehA/McbA family metallohydrolase [Anaerolineae bacterium]|jgi:hypothetical protein|nr:CehA/McbA family metallohydrolase [Anaerolineae bacterium]